MSCAAVASASPASSQVPSESALTAIGIETVLARPSAVASPSSPERRDRIVLEQRELAGQPDEGVACLRRPHRLGAHQHDPAELLLERLDALTDCRGGDVELLRRGVEGARVDDGGQCLEEFAGESHH